MRFFNFDEMVGGWFIGDFTPTAYNTSDFEVSFKTHPKGEIWATHYHKVAVEINLIVFGRMTIQDILLNAGTIFVVDPGEIVDPVFHEDCGIVCVKVPSVKNDKYIV
jgi:hypothetical protein